MQLKKKNVIRTSLGPLTVVAVLTKGYRAVDAAMGGITRILPRSKRLQHPIDGISRLGKGHCTVA